MPLSPESTPALGTLPTLAQSPACVRNARTYVAIRQRLRTFGPRLVGQSNKPRNAAHPVRRNYFSAFIFLNFTLFPSACRVAM
jgi:hypothetical protein